MLGNLLDYFPVWLELLEAKLSNEKPPASITRFQDTLNIPEVLLIKKDNIKKVYNINQNNILVINPITILFRQERQTGCFKQGGIKIKAGHRSIAYNTKKKNNSNKSLL